MAVAGLLHANRHTLRLWEFDRREYQRLIADRSNEKKLPGVRIPPEIEIIHDLDLAIRDVDYIVLALPAQKVRSVCQSLVGFLDHPVGIVNLAKGIELGTLMRMSEVIASVCDQSTVKDVATISGPSHAEEVARQIPTSVVAASNDESYARTLQAIFSNAAFRVYRSDDLVGVELGGSLKNIIAIAAGIVQGLGFGDNTLGALLTRGLAEITRMGVDAGARALTFSGLSGIGDLVTTCLSRHSRNRHVGERIGRGEKLNDILDSMVMVAEGVDTCRSAYAMSRKYDVEMPITGEVYYVLFEDKPPAEAVRDLMGRSLKTEIWS